MIAARAVDLAKGVCIDTAPSAAGLPGADQIGNIIKMASYVSLAACALAFVVAGATFAFAHRGGRVGMEANAKQGMIYALGGAALIAAASGLISFATNLGGAVSC